MWLYLHIKYLMRLLISWNLFGSLDLISLPTNRSWREIRCNSLPLKPMSQGGPRIKSIGCTFPSPLFFVFKKKSFKYKQADWNITCFKIDCLENKIANLICRWSRFDRKLPSSSSTGSCVWTRARATVRRLVWDRAAATDRLCTSAGSRSRRVESNRRVSWSRAQLCCYSRTPPTLTDLEWMIPL